MMARTLSGGRGRQLLSADAVVVIPGVMGSTLRAGGRVLWGMESLGWYAKSWTSRVSSLNELALTSEEQEGRYGRIRATTLLRVPAWAPFLAAIEPYTCLVNAIRRVVTDPSAVREFAYDWRLPIAYNAAQLDRVARGHLANWRSSSKYSAFRRERPSARPAQLVLVAHSAGGLLARALPDDLDVRATVTIGTPFDGAAKAALMVNRGDGSPVPLPRSKLRDLARTLPGIYDLLPTYRCLDEPGRNQDPRRLTPADVKAIGGDPEQAERAFQFHSDLSAHSLPGHHSIIGINQRTDSTLTIADGVLHAHAYTFELSGNRFERDGRGVLVRSVRGGDGTVPDNSALPPTAGPAIPVAQQHGPLTRSTETLNAVCDVILGRDPNAQRLGGREIGIALPDMVEVGTEFAVEMVCGVTSPTSAVVTVHYDIHTAPVAYPAIHRIDGRYAAMFRPERPGIYRITVAGGGATPVTQLVLVHCPQRRNG